MSKINVVRTAAANINKLLSQDGRPVIEFASEMDKEFGTPPRRKFSAEIFNLVTGGGIPYSRCVQIYGGSDCGKTTACLNLVAACQSRGDICAWLNFESKFDKGWAVANGVKWDESFLLVPSADYAEQGLQVILEVIEARALDLIIVDSVAALAPKGELLDGSSQRSLDKDTQALVARMLSKFFRKLMAYMAKANTSIIFINQIRESISAYGNPEVTPGGRALKHYVCLNIGMRRAGKAETTEISKAAGGFTTKAMCKKMQVSPAPGYNLQEGMEVFASFMPGKGFDSKISAIEAALITGKIQHSGKSFIFPDGTKIVGKDNAIQAVVENENLYKLLTEVSDAECKPSDDSGELPEGN